MPQPVHETDFEEGHGTSGLGQKIGFVLGLVVAAVMLWLGAPEGLDPKAWKALSLLALMIVWWVSEAIPVAATALLPLGAFAPPAQLAASLQASVSGGVSMAMAWPWRRVEENLNSLN